jgi:hypothetical protein
MLVLGLLVLCASFGMQTISDSVDFSVESSQLEQQVRRPLQQALR